jgi:hypothetical protein
MDFGPHETKYWGKGRFDLEGYYSRRNARVNPAGEYNNIDREWRSRFFTDQKLGPNDQKMDLYRNPEYRKATLNIFRRAWRWPMNQLEFKVFDGIFKMTPSNARSTRYCVSFMSLMLFTSWTISYYTMYKSNDWTKVTSQFLYYFYLMLVYLNFVTAKWLESKVGQAISLSW